ncbi:MAG: DUF6090 family protein [Burkholderiales bacterium]
MILRRVIEHVRHQQWTAIAIDFVIVVIGVFVGIQVSNWNEDRATQRKAAVFTEHLRADMVEEDWGYQFLIAYNHEVLANAEQAVAALDGTAPLADEALLVAAYRATQYKQRMRRRSTYDELISTGTIGLIGDRAVRDTAMRLYNMSTFDNLVREGLQSRYREAFRMTLPNPVQRALGKQCGDRFIRTGDMSAIHGILDYPCRTGLPPPVIADAAAALRANRDLVPYLRLRIADIDTRLVDLTGNNRELMANLRAIASDGH